MTLSTASDAPLHFSSPLSASYARVSSSLLPAHICEMTPARRFRDHGSVFTMGIGDYANVIWLHNNDISPERSNVFIRGGTQRLDNRFHSEKEFIPLLDLRDIYFIPLMNSYFAIVAFLRVFLRNNQTLRKFNDIIFLKI